MLKGGLRRKTWKIRDDYRPLLGKALELFPTMLGHVERRRILLCSFHCRRSPYLAKIRRVDTPWSLLIPDYDYSIEFWATRFDSEKEAYRLYVMVHELSHIHTLGHKVGTRFAGRLLGHDIEDFLHLRLMYGVQLGNVTDIFKGEKGLFKKGQISRFPRLARLG